MRYLKKFNENKDIFLEYRVEWTENGTTQQMDHSRLSKVLRYVRLENIKDYTILGRVNKEDWKVVMKIGK